MVQYIGDKLIKGSAWSIASRFCLRGIGLINTIILARLLKPEDFGLIALSMLAVGLVMLFSSTGMGQAILRRQEVDENLLNTAWTLRIMAGSVLSIIIFLLAPFSASYFNDPRIEPIMQLIALQPFFESLNNIGFVLYAKNLEFNKVFYRTLLSKILAVSAGIALAFWLKNYWALAIGMVVQNAITTAMSYLMHPYRPQLCLKAAKELATDSINAVSKNMAIYLKQKADEFFVGTLGGASSLGGYYIAKSVTNMLTSELIQPAGQALLPGYSQMKHDPERFKKAILKVLQAVSLLSFACSFGLAAISQSFVVVVFGSQWEHIIPYFEIFALLGGITALQSVTGPALIAQGKLSSLSYLAWFNLICFITILWPLSQTENILLIAQTILGLSCFTFILNYGLLVKYTHISLLDISKSMFRPCLAALSMFYGIDFIQKALCSNLNDIFVLFFSTIIGVYIFTTVILLLWFLSKKPDGIESLIIHTLFKNTRHG